MPFYFIRWNDYRLGKLEDHGVDPEDFEAIVQDPEDVERSHTGRLIAFGNDCEGHLLACVYDLDADGINVHPITAYRIED